ncbi:hypothetical protein BQ8482_110346 [Mesorhizobium delmotii]|uniref:Uncharacterized protein n=1 Tax=Mesorhizobium delmotii TaxID=1631247 RepID=A0A2P9ABB8_9HYPH|nr:hypothetical protein BQ8482_110346 [Mesorhizobium delmotii]
MGRHKRPNPLVKTSNAVATGTSTVTDLRTGAGLMIAVIISPLGFVDLVSEGVERVPPHLVEPGTHLAETMRVDMVDIAGAARLGADQPCLLQHLQMMRDRGLRHRQGSSEVRHRTRPFGHKLEYLSARGVGQCDHTCIIISHGL